MSRKLIREEGLLCGKLTAAILLMLNFITSVAWRLLIIIVPGPVMALPLFFT